MATGSNAVIAAKQPRSRKRGGQPGNTNAFELGSLMLRQRSATRRVLLEQAPWGAGLAWFLH